MRWWGWLLLVVGVFVLGTLAWLAWGMGVATAAVSAESEKRSAGKEGKKGGTVPGVDSDLYFQSPDGHESLYGGVVIPDDEKPTTGKGKKK